MRQHSRNLHSKRTSNMCARHHHRRHSSAVLYSPNLSPRYVRSLRSRDLQLHHASTMRPPRVRHAARTPRGSLSPLGHQPLLFHSASVLTRDCRAITNRTNYEPSHYCTASSNSVGSKDVHCGGAEGAEMTQSVGRKALELGSTRSDRTCSTLLRALRASAVNAFGLVMATTEPATTDPRTTAEPMIGFC